MKKENITKNGFTLVETLVYIALTIVTVTIFTAFTTDIVRSSSRVLNIKEVHQNSRTILARITQEIKTARAVNSVVTDRINFVDKDGSTVEFYYDAPNKTVIYDNGSLAVALNNDSVKVVGFSFSNSGNIIIVNLTIEGAYSSQPGTNYNLVSSATVIPRSALY